MSDLNGEGARARGRVSAFVGTATSRRPFASSNKRTSIPSSMDPDLRTARLFRVYEGRRGDEQGADVRSGTSPCPDSGDVRLPRIEPTHQRLDASHDKYE